MSFNTNDLQLPLSLSEGVNKYLNQEIRTPTNFGPTSRMFSSMANSPSLGLGPGGAWQDPNMTQSANQTANLQQRGDVANQDLQNKQQDAGLL